MFREMPLDDDKKILECLDGNWRTISQIRTRLRHRRTDGNSSPLQRLADTGRIETRTRNHGTEASRCRPYCHNVLRYSISVVAMSWPRDRLDLHQHRERGRRRGPPEGLCQRGCCGALFAENDPEGVAFEYPVASQFFRRPESSQAASQAECGACCCDEPPLGRKRQ